MTATDSTTLLSRWFDSLSGVPPETVARIRAKVQEMMDTGACSHLIPQLPADYRAGAELQACVEEAIRKEWDTLSAEERLLIRFPTTRKVGEQVELPKRGVGTIIRRELTKRFGILLTFRLVDGSLFSWEFFD